MPAPQGGEGGGGRQMGRVLQWGLTADACTQGQLLTGLTVSLHSPAVIPRAVRSAAGCTGPDVVFISCT